MDKNCKYIINFYLTIQFPVTNWKENMPFVLLYWSQIHQLGAFWGSFLQYTAEEKAARHQIKYEMKHETHMLWSDNNEVLQYTYDQK